MNRRSLLKQATATLGLLTLSACASRSEPRPPMTEAERLEHQSRQRMLARFGERGHELVVDALEGHEFFAVEFLTEHRNLLFFRRGVVTRRNESKYMRSGPVPERLRIVWYDEAARMIGGRIVGTIIHDQLVEVGPRIPQALIDDLRRDPKGNLRLKFRLHPDTVLFGWDIQRRPGFDPKKRDKYGEIAYVGPVHSFAGGDFREARIFNGRPERLGWYIHPRTGQTIDTDY